MKLGNHMENELFSLKTLFSALTFSFNEMHWILYSDHVHSNYDKLDIAISIYNRECAYTSFLINYYDPYTHASRRVIQCNTFEDLAVQLRAFRNIHNIREKPQIDFIDVLFGSNAKA